MQDTTQMPAMEKECTAGLRYAAGGRHAWVGLFLVGSLLAGCGIGGPVAEGSAALLSGMPKCDPSLLHPRIEVGAAAGLPGKLIVYVDGVMACVDDAGRVDQLLTQLLPTASAPGAPTATSVPR